MLLGELLSRPVECEGRRVGFVVDVRLVLHGEAEPGGLARPEVVGVVVGRRRGLGFLGYERTDMTRPVLVHRYLAWRQRGSFLVDVSDVLEVGDSVALRPGFQRWSSRLRTGQAPPP